MTLNISESTQHIVYYNSREKKEKVVNLLRSIKARTGEKFGEIILKVLKNYYE